MNEKYMEAAINEAKKAYQIDEVPVGAVIVHNNKIIASAHNLRETEQQATYHAEILAINEACKKLDTWRLNDCTMYVTLEPCPMCAGAIIQARIGKLVYATEDKKTGYCGSLHNTLNDTSLNHQTTIETGVLKNESKELLKSFFREKRAKNK